MILFPPLLIAFLLVMERVEEPLRRPTSQREVEEFLGTATDAEVGTLANSGIRRAMGRWRARRRGRTRTAPRPVSAPDRTTTSSRPWASPPRDVAEEVLVVALIVILFPPLLIAFLLVMERVEEPLRRPTSQREVEDFLGTATEAEVGTLANSGIRRAMARWRARRRNRARTTPRPVLTERSAGPTGTDAG